MRGFKRLYHADRSEIIWLPEHVAAFMRVAPIELQRALILALHSGQRQGDLLRLPWSAYNGSTITLRQGKARPGRSPGPPVIVPCTAALRRMLDGMERTSPLILTTRTGQSFKKRYFARLWDEAMTKASLQSVTLPGSEQPVELHFHDLRGTTVTLLSETGCTPQQIAPITGHSLKTVHRILEHYLARTSGTRRAGNLQLGELRANKVCKPAANQHPCGIGQKGKTRCQTMTWLARPERFERPTPRSCSLMPKKPTRDGAELISGTAYSSRRSPKPGDES